MTVRKLTIGVSTILLLASCGGIEPPTDAAGAPELSRLPAVAETSGNDRTTGIQNPQPEPVSETDGNEFAPDGARPEEVPWPSDITRESELEKAIGAPGSTSGAFEEYQRRHVIGTEWCMGQGGFTYVVGEAITDQAASDWLVAKAVIDGVEYLGGCEAFAPTIAFPGNQFGAPYQTMVDEATKRTEFLDVVAAYDECLIDAGFATVPEADTTASQSENQALFDSYISAANICDEANGLSDANRSLEIYVGDRFARAYPEQVEEYAQTLSRIIDPEGE